MISSVLFQLLGLAAFLVGLLFVFGPLALLIGGGLVTVLGTVWEVVDMKNRTKAVKK